MPAFLIQIRYLSSFLYHIFICLAHWFLFTHLVLVFFPVILFWQCHLFLHTCTTPMFCFVASSMKYLLFLSKFWSIYPHLSIISRLKRHILMPLCQTSFSFQTLPFQILGSVLGFHGKVLVAEELQWWLLWEADIRYSSVGVRLLSRTGLIFAATRKLIFPSQVYFSCDSHWWMISPCSYLYTLTF